MSAPIPPRPAYDDPSARAAEAAARALARGDSRRARLGIFGILICLVVASLLGAGPNRWVAALVPDGDSHYAFMRTDPGSDSPVAWNNCKAIHYVVNSQGAPADWQPLISNALAEIKAASGYVFVYDGTTRDRDFGGNRSLGDPVLIGWGARKEYGEIGNGEVVGLGGPYIYSTTHGLQSGSGHIVFDSLYFAQLERTGDLRYERVVVLHEWMHVLGLTHVKDPRQVMAPGSSLANHLGKGDIAGLKALRAVPCPGAT